MLIETKILEKLNARFMPTMIALKNQTHKHKGHLGANPANSETHFDLLISSDIFKEMPILMRHRLIYQTLSDEFAAGLHALSIKAMSSNE